MKRLLSLAVLLIACGCLLTATAQESFYNITPYPKSITKKTGVCTFPKEFTVGVDAALGDSTMQVAQAFVDQLNATMKGHKATLVHSIDGAFIQISNGGRIAAVGKEGYNLTISTENIRISALYETGFYYALQSVKKMLPANVCAGVMEESATGYSIPCCTIADAPRWEYRSFMLDCSRHFFEVSEKNRITFYKMETRVFTIYALPVTSELSANIAGTASGETGDTTSASMSSSISLDLWSQIQDTITSMLPTGASMNVIPGNGTLTVTAPPATLQRVSEYIKNMNERLARQVSISVKVLNVEVEDSQNNGFSLATALEYTGKHFKDLS